MADEAKPAYVIFENRTVEDREASSEAGHYVGRDVIFAIVTPAGTRDRIEREATDWLANVAEGVKQDRIPASWLTAYEGALKAFKESREAPEFGTPIIDWPGASPAQIKGLLDMSVRTVEDLAAANEETVMRIGMGGRALKAKAQAWLEASEGPGKLAAEMDSLRVENSELKTRNEELNARLEKLEAKVGEEA